VSLSSPLLQLILVSLMAHLALAGSRITTSLYALSLHASEFTVGTLIALFSLFPMLCAVSTGRLIDRIGIVTPMRAGCVAMTIGCALPGFVGGLPVLYAATILIGTGFMIVHVAAQHSVGAMSATDRRTTNFSWLALGFSISGFSGPVLAGLVIEHARYSIAYMTFGVCTFGALALVVFGHLKRIQSTPRNETNQPSGALDLLRDVEMRHIYIVGILLAAAWDLFIFVVPIQGTRSGFSASTIGLILGCFSAATFIIRLAMPWISRHLSEWQVLTAALMLAALSYALFPLMHQPLSLMIIASILGIAVGCSQSNMLALIHHHAPAGRVGEAVGLRVTIGNASQVVLPLAFGGAGAALGMSAVFWSVGAMIGAGIPLAWRKTARR
jgi:MFS family permease